MEAGGERFRFYYDPERPTVLHITWRHGTTPEDAVAAFFEADRSEWDEHHARWKSTGDRHTVYWARHAYDGSVVVITCFERWDD